MIDSKKRASDLSLNCPRNKIEFLAADDRSKDK